MTLAAPLEDRAEDLPRTIRRAASDATREPAQHTVLREIDIAFPQLVMFFLKAALAAIPAIVVLTLSLVVIGELLVALFPSLAQLKILIYAPS